MLTQREPTVDNIDRIRDDILKWELYIKAVKTRNKQDEVAALMAYFFTGYQHHHYHFEAKSLLVKHGLLDANEISIEDQINGL